MNDSWFEVVVEIPKGSRNKYEIDHDTGALWLDRHLFTATSYPADYGFVPNTLAEDDDPLDVLVLLDEPTVPGCHIRARAIGVFWMSDEKGPDAKILAVPANDPRWDAVARARRHRQPPARGDQPFLRGVQGARTVEEHRDRPLGRSQCGPRGDRGGSPPIPRPLTRAQMSTWVPMSTQRSGGSWKWTDGSPEFRLR